MCFSGDKLSVVYIPIFLAFVFVKALIFHGILPSLSHSTTGSQSFIHFQKPKFFPGCRLHIKPLKCKCVRVS